MYLFFGLWSSERRAGASEERRREKINISQADGAISSRRKLVDTLYLIHPPRDDEYLFVRTMKQMELLIPCLPSGAICNDYKDKRGSLAGAERGEGPREEQYRVFI